MYGDTQAIRRLARAMEEQATAIRTDADELVSAAEQVWWEGMAARAMRERMIERALALRLTADRHDDAAQALRDHAAEVDRLKDLIADIARRVERLVDGARSRLADLAAKAVDAAKRVVSDPVDEVLAAFRPPPAGHLDWLAVPEQLPGVAA